ncbi:MAG: cobyrinate a,c-diamide synthase [Actinomycetales bacterium]
MLVAAPASGQGKTTIATGLMAALTRAGVQVAPAKVGPDYIDPGYHAMATGRPGRNLDPWLVGEELIEPLLLHGARTPHPADLAVIEGVMGLFDGMLGRDGFSSSAHVARLTRTPVLLVVDVTGAARTVAAVAAGLAGFDPDVHVGGVILNRVGSARHADEATRAVERAGLAVVGAVPRDARVGAPSRHLGLVPTAERADAHDALDRLAAHVGGHLDLDAVLEVARAAPDLEAPAWDPAHALQLTGFVPPISGSPDAPVVAIAAGPAFTFRYTEIDELLRAAGCDPVPFDPATDTHLPHGTRALYLGGGFPQVHAGALVANRALLTQIRAEIADGLPTYAECAGMLYLCDRLDEHPMAGVVPAAASMSARLTLRYATAIPHRDGLLTRAGEELHGHEFHRTATHPASGADAAWQLSSSFAAATDEGFLLDPAGVGSTTVHASYLHVHPAGHPEMIGRLAAAARRYQPGAGRMEGRSVPAGPRSDTRSPAADPLGEVVPVGEVVLVGGGPGDPGLLTVAGLDAIATADVIVCDRLAPLASLQVARPDARVIHVGKIPRGPYTPQEQINAILIDHARQGRKVVRFKGGDNFVFGRGGEEWVACTQAGVPVRVIPGVTSSVAAPGLAGIPLTHRTLTQGFVVVSGHVPPDDPRSQVNWAALAGSGLTIVVLMGVAALPKICATLIEHGLGRDTPAATIADAGHPSMRVVRGTVDSIADRTAGARIEPPAVTVIGPVVHALDAPDAAAADGPDTGSPPGDSRTESAPPREASQHEGSLRADPQHAHPRGSSDSPLPHSVPPDRVPEEAR